MESAQESVRADTAFPIGGGEMGASMRAMDWSRTDVGAPEGWPNGLRAAVQLVLGSRYPMFVWWGDRLTNFYNDGYIPVLGQRHPYALGQPAAEVWREIWDVLGPQVDEVLRLGAATWNEDLLLVMERNGYVEETYFTFSYSPVRDDDGRIAGLFCACSEETAKVLAERRMRTLRELAAATPGVRTVSQACEVVFEVLAQNPYDVPFAALYLGDGDPEAFNLLGARGLVDPDPTLHRGNARWPLADDTRVVHRSGGFRTEGAPWPEPAETAVVIPLESTGRTGVGGYLVLGASPRRKLDDEYRGFFELVAKGVATAIATARAYEEAQERAEALAELDRAKTAFFSNVSHELRTPLTLLLGPLEGLLADESAQSVVDRRLLTLMHRNGMRLLRLVNSLLDFSRIEAKREEPLPAPTDLAELTADVASAFRGAIEGAGLRFTVDCPPLPHLVHVDRAMWEKVVLNLLSNAFKFTLEGEIRLSLRAEGTGVVLEVADTGEGIPEAEIPRLFERFHRVSGQRSRTHEGTGIGLALVHELVGLHGGTVDVMSERGRGSTFRVSLPGIADEHIHIAAGRVGSPLRSAFVAEAEQWDASPATVGPGPSESDSTLCRVLVADDNADMREYVAGLLAPSFDVVLVEDGAKALDEVRRQRPDLVLTDVMMPNLDGFGLLKALREDPKTADLPVVMLSARAGVESRSEGLDAGADDYLVKPFSAEELLARVSTHIRLAHERSAAQEALREREEHLRLAVAIAQIGTFDIDLATDRVEVNERGREIYGWAPEDALTFSRVQTHFHPDDRDWVVRRVAEALAPDGPEEFEVEQRILRTDGDERWIRVRGRALFEGAGSERRAVRCVGTYLDVTDRRRQENALRTLNEELEARVEQRTADLMAKNEALQGFTYSVSHDMRAPLRAMVANARIVLEEEGPRLTKEGSGNLSRLAAAALRMSNLIDDLLQYARLGDREVRRERTNLSDLAKQVAGDVLRDYPEVELELTVTPGLEAECDPRLIGLAIHNLLDNACKYRKPGPRVEVEFGRVGEAFYVEDHGIGFDMAYVGKLFQPFERLHREEYAGTGIGLANVRRAVERHGGRAWAEGVPGQGATFFFTLS